MKGFSVWVLFALLAEFLLLCRGHGDGGAFPFSAVQEKHDDHDHGCDHSHSHSPSPSHDHSHHHHHDHDHHHDHSHSHSHSAKEFKHAEELAEEEDLKRFGFASHFHDEDEELENRLSGTSLWLHAMGCSLLVSMASLVCLIILPLIVWQGKPSKTVVDMLAAFGAGAMLGDAFLHQLPHALGGFHNHSHHLDHGHNHFHGESHVNSIEGSHGHQHSHSLEELSVGLAALGGMILFFIVEKIVRYVEEYSSQGDHSFHIGHHNHHKRNKSSKKKDGHGSNSTISSENDNMLSDKNGKPDSLNSTENGSSLEEVVDPEDSKSGTAKKRGKFTTTQNSKKHLATNLDSSSTTDKGQVKSASSSSSNLVIGYLNLFSDGVHNFTDGMALGSAFLLHGSIGGWSRTLFLLAHELPQEVGDFGILVRSGFNVFTALFFNFLSALVALGGTALALLIGSNPGHSSLIEGFTAGGFIYIAMVGVLPEMHQKETSFRTTFLQLASLMSGMGVALCISLLE